jgi:energy-coupling factor transporter ATP-binding protein EcfA2
MQLRRLRIENYRAIKKRDFSFEDALGRIRPVTVLAGPNGCGKTSVLWAIVQALRGVTGYRTDDVPQPSDLEIHRSGTGGGWTSEPTRVLINLDIQFDTVELKAIPQVLRETEEAGDDDIRKLPELPDGVLHATWQYPPERDEEGRRKPTWFLSDTEPRASIPWLKGRGRAIRGWKGRQLSSRKVLDDIGGIYLFPQDRNLRSRVVGDSVQFSDTDTIGSGVAVEEPQKPARREYSVWGVLEYLSNYVHGQRPESQPLPDEENWEKRIMDHFFRICGPKEYAGFMYQGDDLAGAPCIRDGNIVYSLQQAASGEQVIIEYLTRLTCPSPMNHSLILIDEPEIHLHPGWIRQLYRALPRIGINNQFILSTHSLELRAMAAEDGALIDMGEMELDG